ncbi:MAG: NAD(P)H-dependent oxidoreductase [Candidatus Obscuribacterales bacterium]|nr:NAD(P)H-dependent oxidoreductase [Steroidobacteraceae bacterium]
MSTAIREKLPFIVGIGGTTQPNSATEKSLRLALTAAAAHGARTKLIDGPALARMPIYVPERTDRTAEQLALVQAVREADGLIIATPSYHAGMSGLIKNAMDLLEDLRDDARPYLDRRAVGCIVTAFGWQGGGATLGSVRTIVHALRGWPTPLAVTLNTAEPLFDADGTCIDAKACRQLDVLAGQVVEFAQRFNK